MTPDHTLVVIDIQPTFQESAWMVVDPIREEMRAARVARIPILLVEYLNQGDTLVRDAVQGYDKVWVVTKSHDSGAKEIEQALELYSLPPTLRVMGVNTGACVLRTVRGLAQPLRKIDVVGNCCWCRTAASNQCGIDDLKLLPGVTVV